MTVKLTLIIFLGWLPLFALSQDSTVTYSDVIKVDGVSKNDLMNRARQWSVDHLKSVKEQKPDSTLDVLSGKGAFKTIIASRNILDEKDTYEILYMGTIWVKDGRYKYQFTSYEVQKDGLATAYGTLTTATDPPNIKGMMGKGGKRATWQGCKKDVEKQTEQLVETLKAAMTKASVTEF